MFQLPENRSLKGKRQVSRSLSQRIRNRFNVSVAEVEAQDNRQLAVLGLAMVGNETQPIRSTLGQIVEALRSHPVAELLDYDLEV